MPAVDALERGRASIARGAWRDAYFVGLPFLQAFASMLIGGVGRDADHVAKHIAACGRAGAPQRRRRRGRRAQPGMNRAAGRRPQRAADQ